MTRISIYAVQLVVHRCTCRPAVVHVRRCDSAAQTDLGYHGVGGEGGSTAVDVYLGAHTMIPRARRHAHEPPAWSEAAATAANASFPLHVRDEELACQARFIGRRCPLHVRDVGLPCPSHRQR